jgi:hypothetical protein
MSQDKTFIPKALRPDVTKPVSAATYAPATPTISLSAEEHAFYPGVSLKGCSKDGKDGKDGSDGSENPQRIREMLVELPAARPVGDLGAGFRPQLRAELPQALNINVR